MLTNSVLRERWHTGESVPKRAHPHPYQASNPLEYFNEGRRFLFDANVNPRFPWGLTTEMPVFAPASVKGALNAHARLVYAHSPLRDRRNVRLTVPNYGAINVDVAAAGSFLGGQRKETNSEASSENARRQ